MSLSKNLYLEGKANTSYGTGMLYTLEKLPKDAKYFGSDEIKNEMIFQVQKIFDGEITVEDYIKMFDAQYENSLDVKTLNKYFRR